MKDSLRDFLLPVHSPARELPAKKMKVDTLMNFFLSKVATFIFFAGSSRAGE
jgi:hypothetical protein